MAYQFNFGPVFKNFDVLLAGLYMTVWLTVAAIVVGTAIGLVFAAIRARGGMLAVPVAIYVEIVRNTPFLVQIYILYFSVPALGLRVSATEAALLGMGLNLAAYSTEIIRSGIESIHRSQIEAGLALGLTRFQVFRNVVLIPALRKVYPALASQYTLVMLMSSVCSAISTNELTAVATTLANDNFRYFETYAVLSVMYLSLAFAFRALCDGLGRLLLEPRRRRSSPSRLALGAVQP